MSNATILSDEQVANNPLIILSTKTPKTTKKDKNSIKNLKQRFFIVMQQMVKINVFVSVILGSIGKLLQAG